MHAKDHICLLLLLMLLSSCKPTERGIQKRITMLQHKVPQAILATNVQVDQLTGLYETPGWFDDGTTIQGSRLYVNDNGTFSYIQVNDLSGPTENDGKWVSDSGVLELKWDTDKSTCFLIVSYPHSLGKNLHLLNYDTDTFGWQYGLNMCDDEPITDPSSAIIMATLSRTEPEP